MKLQRTGLFLLAALVLGLGIAAGCHSGGGDGNPGGMFLDEPTFEAETPDEPWMVCHVPDGDPANAETLMVEAADVDTHLSHGDSLGACLDDVRWMGDDDDDDDALTPLAR